MPVVQPVLDNSYKHLYIYMIIVGKLVPVDNYEQYKRVINQITGDYTSIQTLMLSETTDEDSTLLKVFVP